MTLRELIEELGIPIAPEGHHHCTPYRVQIDCPHCSPGSGKFRMGLHEFKYSCHCWVCGGRHGFFACLSAASGTAYKAICGLASGLDRPTPRSGRLRDARPLRIDPPGGVVPLGRAHRRYLAGRGFDPDTLVRDWEIGGITQVGRNPWSIYIPVKLNGKLVTYTSRSLSDTGLRYVSAPDSDSVVGIHDVLYGADDCTHAIVLNEGPLDAWAVGHGLGSCTFGLGVTDAQLIRASRFPVRIVLADAEPAAQKRAEEMCWKLAMFPGETHRVELETGKDASRADPEELEQLRRRFL